MNLDIIIYIIIAILLVYQFYNRDELEFIQSSKTIYITLAGIFLIIASLYLPVYITTNAISAYTLSFIIYLFLSIIFTGYYLGFNDNTWSWTTIMFITGQLIGLMFVKPYDNITRFSIAMMIVFYNMFLTSIISSMKVIFEYISHIGEDKVSELNDIIISIN